MPPRLRESIFPNIPQPMIERGGKNGILTGMYAMNSTSLRVLSATLFAALTLCAAAQHPATTNRPRLVCDQPVFDYGTVDASTVVEHTFTIRNEGTLTLEISRVHASCGCTVANISSQQIPPGGESQISSRLSLQGRSGPQQKTIVIDSNDPDQPQYVLTLRGVVGAALNVQPQQIMMPRVTPGSQPQANVILTSGDGTEYSVTGVDSTSDLLQANVVTIEDRKTYRVDLGLKQPLEGGAFNAMVVVRTDHPKRPAVEIPVTFIAAREIVVAPREIAFDKPGDQPVSRFVLIRNADGAPVELDGVEAPDSSVQVVTQPFGANGLRIQMSNLVPSREMNGRVLRIHSRSSGVIDVPIRINGIDG